VQQLFPDGPSERQHAANSLVSLERSLRQPSYS
jgi:hypothetical protein